MLWAYTDIIHEDGDDDHQHNSAVHIINPLAPELFFLILAHTVYKMWII